uniref:ATP-binding protein n=1 Tax=Ndongobacter massiliensis TaxID=1871025 RepID=UPI00092FF972|nr:ATP-binding protein [Ndongobacter massiliensis]
MIFNRDRYTEALIRKKWNGRIKVITGVRRCGKSTVLFELFQKHLLETGTPKRNIISLALDDDTNKEFRDPDKLSEYVHKLCGDSSEQYFLLLDEIQFAISREELKNTNEPIRLYSILNGFLHMKNVDIYVTGSNSKLLSKDVSTEFRGRGDTIQVFPLSFHEYLTIAGKDKRDAYDEYIMYGGMPYLLRLDSDEEKYSYLNELFEEIYFKDIEERYEIRLPGVLRELTSSLCSSVGSLTNSSKIARTVNSKKGIKTDSETISTYLSYLTDSFLFSKAERYDIKGKRYFDYPSKFYCSDIGLRNVRLGLRQQEETHIMENVIYNELRIRGFLVDVGNVDVVERNQNGKRIQKNLEVDFIARKGSKKYYVQSALNMDDASKANAELRSLKAINDSFQKIIISKSYGKSWTDESGILRLGIMDFLLDETSLNR